MPYIKQSERSLIRARVKDLFVVLTLDSGSVDWGKINYAITLLLLSIWRRALSYTTINNIAGVLECVKAEFYRRAAAPYEDSKRNSNGDVESFDIADNGFDDSYFNAL